MIASETNSSANSTSLPRRRREWLAYGLTVAAIVALVVCLAAIALVQEKQRYRERAAEATNTIAHLLDQQMSDVFDKVDVALREAVISYRNQAGLGRLDAQTLNTYLAEQETLFLELDSLRILDKDGLVAFGRDIPTTNRVNLSDREFFIRARDDANAGMIVSGPVFARIAQKWVVVFARRLNAADGSFAGVIYANMATTHFEKALSSIALGPYGAVSIRKADLALVHRAPKISNAVGSKEVSAQLLESIKAHPEGGHYIAATALDGIERHNTYLKLQRYPFYVIVGLAPVDFMRGWKRNVFIVSGLAGLALVITCLAALFLYRAHRRLAGDLEELRRIGTELEHAADERTQLNAELEIRAREAEAANIAKTAFLANMSHEMRTPLNHVTGLTYLIRREPLTPQQIDRLDKLDSASHNLSSIITRILELTKIETGTIDLAEQSFSLKQLLNEAIDAFLPQAAEKHLLLLAEPGDVPDRLVGNKGAIVRALNNYLSNAIRFTPTGTVTLRSTLVEENAQGVLIRFEVTDTGIGIADEDQARLFSIFEQVDNSSTRQYGGLGVGLAMTRKIARLSGGDAGCSSVQGEGSTFWFTVRVHKADAGA